MDTVSTSDSPNCDCTLSTLETLITTNHQETLRKFETLAHQLNEIQIELGHSTQSSAQPRQREPSNPRKNTTRNTARLVRLFLQKLVEDAQPSTTEHSGK